MKKKRIHPDGDYVRYHDGMRAYSKNKMAGASKPPKEDDYHENRRNR
jgi:hypothetical protein